jgi:FKBP-type peptidyl-prolyl cis-trans isomerase SlpA
LEVFVSKAKNKDTVKIHYTEKLANGKAFENSGEGGPFEFTVGTEDVTPGIEKGVLGMETGDKKTIEIPPEEAFGQRREELVVEIGKSELPVHMEGMEVAEDDVGHDTFIGCCRISAQIHKHPH